MRHSPLRRVALGLAMLALFSAVVPASAAPAAQDNLAILEIASAAGIQQILPRARADVSLRRGERADVYALCQDPPARTQLFALVYYDADPDDRIHDLAALSMPAALVRCATPELKIELREGPVQIQEIDSRLALTVETPTMVITAPGSQSFAASHFPDTGTSRVYALQGTVSVQPKNPAVPATALQPGQSAQITAQSIGAIQTAAPAVPFSILVLGALGGALLLALVAAAIFWIAASSRAQRPSPTPIAPPTRLPERTLSTTQPIDRVMPTMPAARLRVTRGSANPVVLALAREGITLGRETSNALVLDDATASRHHARIESENGAWVIVDLNSVNGTLVNGVRIPRQRLLPGDTIQIGSVEIVFESS